MHTCPIQRGLHEAPSPYMVGALQPIYKGDLSKAPFFMKLLNRRGSAKPLFRGSFIHTYFSLFCTHISCFTKPLWVLYVHILWSFCLHIWKVPHKAPMDFEGLCEAPQERGCKALRDVTKIIYRGGFAKLMEPSYTHTYGHMHILAFHQTDTGGVSQSPIQWALKSFVSP